MAKQSDTMPRFHMYDDGSVFEVPTIMLDAWWAKLAEIAGRPLTEDERKRADRIGNMYWDLRPVADRLFGAELVAAYFD